ncbi:Uncharacterized protein QTN25_003623 [Entamoeba marina]
MLSTLKMIIISLPNLEKMIGNDYEKVFTSTTLTELFCNFTPLVWKFFRNKSVPVEEKLQLFLLCITFETDNGYDTYHFSSNLNLQKIINSMGNSHKSHIELITSPSQKEIDMFDRFINLIDTLDKQQIVSIDKMVDPYYFNPLFNNTPSEFKQKQELHCIISKIFQKATPQQLQEYVEFLKNEDNWDGWNLSFDITTLSLGTLKQFIEQFTN